MRVGPDAGSARPADGEEIIHGIGVDRDDQAACRVVGWWSLGDCKLFGTRKDSSCHRPIDSWNVGYRCDAFQMRADSGYLRRHSVRSDAPDIANVVVGRRAVLLVAGDHDQVAAG